MKLGQAPWETVSTSGFAKSSRAKASFGEMLIRGGTGLGMIFRPGEQPPMQSSRGTAGLIKEHLVGVGPANVTYQTKGSGERAMGESLKFFVPAF